MYHATAPGLFRDLTEAGLAGGDPSRARAELECLAVHACVRGLVASGGFAARTADAVDAFHASVLEASEAGLAESQRLERRRRIAERHAEYGAIAKEGGASGRESVPARIGAAAARHLAGGRAGPALAETLAALYEALAEAAADAARAALDAS